MKTRLMNGFNIFEYRRGMLKWCYAKNMQIVRIVRKDEEHGIDYEPYIYDTRKHLGMKKKISFKERE